MNIDTGAMLMLFGSGAMTLVTGVATYQIRKYFKNIELAGKRRELKQEIYHMKHDATIYALAVSLDKSTGETFNKNYQDKLKELERERDRLYDVK